MKRPVRLMALAAFCLLSDGVLADRAAAGGAWLDAPRPAGWNQPGAPVPPAPRTGNAAADFARCAEQLRPATSPEDRAVVKAGWRLFGPYQRFGATSILRALSGVDGMCRPLGYQEFVFRDGHFAGTLAPAPMDARTDGATDTIFLYEADRITVTYRRYADTDPLCCPSRTSTVVFGFVGEGVAAVVPEAVTTRPAGAGAAYRPGAPADDGGFRRCRARAMTCFIAAKSASS